MPLEDSFAAFEEGAKLLETLTKMLDAGEKRVMELTGEGEKPLSGEAV